MERWLAHLTVLAFLLVALPTSAQREEVRLDLKRVSQVALDDIDPGVDGERIVELYLRVKTEHDAPVQGLGPEDIEVWQDDEQIDPDDVVIEPLRATGRGITAVLAIDASGTMKDGPFERAKEAAEAFLGELQQDDRVAIVAFAEDVIVVSRFDQQRSETRQALRALEIDPERSQHTLLYDGAYKAIDLIRSSPDLPRRSFVVLLSDGKDDGSDRSREEVIRASTGKNNQAHIIFFTIGYARFDGAGLVEMERLAEGTGGDFDEATSAVHLKDFFDVIAVQMGRSYLVRFPQKMDGESHELRVTVGRYSGSRTAEYPEISGAIWPYILALVVVSLIGVVVFLVMSRSGTAARLSILSGPTAGTVVALRKGKTRIGALEDNDVVLAGTTVSRYHAEIVIRRGSAEITDLRSKNGTRVNGQLVDRSPVKPGDKISLAEVELAYER